MDESVLNTFNQYLSSITFALALVASVAVLILIKMRLDKSMMLLVALFLVGSFLRLPFFIEKDQRKNIALAVAYEVYHSFLYFFVFEMMRLKDLLQSETSLHYAILNRKRKVAMAVFYTVFALGDAAMLLTIYTFYNYARDA